MEDDAMSKIQGSLMGGIAGLIAYEVYTMATNPISFTPFVGGLFAPKAGRNRMMWVFGGGTVGYFLS
jgi:hypothetical protein